MRTGLVQPTPMEWPFTQITNTQQSLDIRLSMFIPQILFSVDF